MDKKAALSALAALSQETRLDIFRLLVQSGPEGRAAGAIADRLRVAPATLSFHLSQLTNAGLIEQRRESRSLIYSAAFGRMNDLLGFLTENCCGNPAPVARCVPECPPPQEGNTTMDESRVYNALFLCTHNSARSVMAECILNREGKGRFRAFSAGSQPSGRINPHVQALLERLGHPVSGLRSKNWDEFAVPGAPVMDFVFTVCDNAAGEVCPVWPGHPATAHWGFPDPSGAQGTDAEKAAFTADVYRRIERRIQTFVNLPFASLDRLALKQRLDDMAND